MYILFNDLTQFFPSPKLIASKKVVLVSTYKRGYRPTYKDTI